MLRLPLRVFSFSRPPQVPSYYPSPPSLPPQHSPIRQTTQTTGGTARHPAQTRPDQTRPWAKLGPTSAPVHLSLIQSQQETLQDRLTRLCSRHSPSVHLWCVCLLATGLCATVITGLNSNKQQFYAERALVTRGVPAALCAAAAGQCGFGKPLRCSPHVPTFWCCVAVLGPPEDRLRSYGNKAYKEEGPLLGSLRPSIALRAPGYCKCPPTVTTKC